MNKKPLLYWSITMCLLLAYIPMFSQKDYTRRESVDTIQFGPIDHSYSFVNVLEQKEYSNKTVTLSIKFMDFPYPKQGIDSFILKHDSLFIVQTCEGKAGIIFLDCPKSTNFAAKIICTHSLLANLFLKKVIYYDSSFNSTLIRYDFDITTQASTAVFIWSITFNKAMDILYFTLYNGDRNIEFRKNTTIKRKRR